MNKRNTLQKGIVFEVFCSMTNHPSAGMVYEAVHEKYPSISRATVYRILAEAAEEGSIQRLKLRDANDRYDITTATHCHIVCSQCGAVADVEIDTDSQRLLKGAKACESFFIEGCHIELYGKCQSCQTQNENQN